MADCKQCGERLSLYEGFGGGICGRCIAENARRADEIRENAANELAAEEQNRLKLEEFDKPEKTDFSYILLTTETAPDIAISRRLDIISAEVVIGMHLFKDIAAAWRDTFGGRSKTMQDGLRDARRTALHELRREAHAIGADAVVAIDLDYSEISGGGKSMLFLVASGTAVKLAS